MIKLQHNPCDSLRVTSPYGPRRRGYHNGIDFGRKANNGEPIYATNDGVVRVNKFNKNGYGWYIVLEHDDFCTLYAHFKARALPLVGERVKAGDVIGYMGTTGASTGVHLHFEIREGRYTGQFFAKDNKGKFKNSINPAKYIITTTDAGGDDVSDWAKDGYMFVTKHNISDGQRPKDQVTRQEVWTMLARFDKFLK